MNTHHLAKKTKLTFLLAAAAVAGAASLPAQDTTSAPVSPVEARLQQLEQDIQQLKILNRQQELKVEKAEADAKKAYAVSFDTKGFNATSADKSYSIKIGTLIQSDFRAFIDDAAPNRDSFLLRRVRLPVSGTFAKAFKFNITPEFAQADNSTATSNNQNTQLVDAWISAEVVPAFSLKIGKFSGPVALETPNNRHFNEASFTNQLAPNRDIGIEAGGTLFDKIFTYRLGLYNGAANNTWAETVNPSDGDFTGGGRISIAPFAATQIKPLQKFEISVGASHGREAGSSGRIRTSGQQDFFNPGSFTGQHSRLEEAIEWYVGPFSLIVEDILEVWNRDNGSTIANYAWRVSGGWVITGEDSSRRGVSPDSSFSLDKGNYGALELVARIGGIKVDSDLGRNINATHYGIGLNWYLTNNLQVRFDVEKTDFGSGVALRKDEIAAFTRVQLTF